MSSPVSMLLNSSLEQMGANSEFYTFFNDDLRKRICKAIVSAYYEEQTDKKTIFDTSRTWTARLHQLADLYQDFKVICCVRNPAWIMDSFERIYRKNPFDYSRMFSPQNRQTVYTRCEALASVAGSLGSAWTALKEAYYGEFSERMLLVDYDLLTQYPEKTIGLLYEFMGEPAFPHNFNHVEYRATEFDDNIGVKGLHDVKREVAFQPRRSILPPDLFAKYQEMAFWLDPVATSASRIVPKTDNSESAEIKVSFDE